MSLFSRRSFGGVTAADLITRRPPARTGAVRVSNDTAMRHSAVWACLRLRADMVSTLPLDVYRRVGGLQVDVPVPPVLVDPGGARWDYCDWMYASQVDLDRAGNAVGLITETNSFGLPSRIDLQPISAVNVVETKKTGVTYRIDGVKYPPEKVWHERQYPVAGLPVGLSPVAYAAWSIGEYQSIQQFALDWFAGGGVPKAKLRNTARTITPAQAAEVKDRFKASVQGGDLFVVGSDWEYDMIQSQTTGSEWLDAKKYGVTDIARFFSCPADLIEGAVSGQSVTYANISQRNLQFLIMNLGPAVFRREKNLSKLLPRPRYVKLNTSALLRMDDETRVKVISARIANRTLAPSEARELENLPPLTEEQMAEFDRLFGSPRTQPTAAATIGS